MVIVPRSSFYSSFECAINLCSALVFVSPPSSSSILRSGFFYLFILLFPPTGNRRATFSTFFQWRPCRVYIGRWGGFLCYVHLSIHDARQPSIPLVYNSKPLLLFYFTYHSRYYFFFIFSYVNFNFDTVRYKIRKKLCQFVERY